MSSWLSYFFPTSAAPDASSAAPSEAEKKAADASAFADYAIKDARPLGSGADAQVVAATHLPTGKRVALKLIEKAKRRPDQLDRSRFESQLISSVFDHPNVVKGYPLVENERFLGIPMEIATMGDLLDYVNSRRGFPEPEARDIFRQLVEGLAHAHSHNILHGDIKLENVLIFPATKEQVRRGDFTRRFAICDWGYARYNTGERLKKAFGSLLYSSPEIVTGTGHFSPATDVWGLGVILYALIYATLPFGGPELRQQIASAAFQFPPHVPVSPDCRDLITSILRIDPGQRLTLDAIRAHPWLSGVRAPLRPVIGSASVSSSASTGCSPLASASSSSASAVSLAVESKESDASTAARPPAPQPSCVSVLDPPAAPAPASRAAASTGRWYLDGDEDLDAVGSQ